MVKNIAEHIGNLIGKDELNEAIHLMHKLINNNKNLDDLIVQSARFSDVTNQIRKGVIDYEKANVTKNKIRYALLDILREIEENENIEISIHSIEGLEKMIPNIQQKHYGKGDNVVNKIINR